MSSSDEYNSLIRLNPFVVKKAQAIKPKLVKTTVISFNKDNKTS